MFKRFLGDKRGNFAILFALSALPLLGAIGMSLEYTNLSRNHAALQSATDAAALFAGRYYLNNHRTLPSDAKFKTFIEANFEGKLDSASMKIVGKNLVVNAESTAPAFFFGNLAPQVFVQDSNATIPINQAVDIEVALVLDVTGSMSQRAGSMSKIDGLKVAAKNFVDTLDIEKQDKDNSVAFSIVPFAAHVRLDTANKNAWWLSAASKTVNTRLCTPASWWNRSGYGSYAYMSHGVVKGYVGYYKDCAYKYITYVWKGCVGSRSGNYPFEDDDYHSRPILGLVYSGNDDYCPAEAATPLTHNLPFVKWKIDMLKADGGTYIAPGVMWGQRMLSPQQPFSEGKEWGSLKQGISQKKIMVVMTDGTNTISRGRHDVALNYGSSRSEADSDTKKTCQAARASGTVIYTIAFGNGVDSQTKALLINCAGADNRFFFAKDAKKLDKAFDDIAGKIMKLHLSS